jgi:23S rRNA (guanosine2251-2'-O)-methyltransferase
VTAPGGSSRRPTDLLYGRNAVTEALRAGRRTVHRVLVARGTHGVDSLARHPRTELVERRRLDDLLGHQHHQGVIAEVSTFPYDRLEDLSLDLLLVLDSLQDPQNFGTLLRTAQACAVSGVVIPEHRAVHVTPAVSNASAGAIEHLRVARVTNLARTLTWLKERNVWVYGLAVEARAPFWSVDWTTPSALVVGSEGEGLGRLVRETCDALVEIPMAEGAVQSLNAAVAGSLVLYEALRQRQQH